MYLYRELSVNVEKLDQKRELTSVIFIYILPDDSLKVGFHKLAYGIASEPAVGKHRVLYAHICDFPAFADECILAYRHLIAFFVALDEVLT